ASCVLARHTAAQSEAGSVAAVVGTLEVKRAGAWQPAGIGVPVFAGDRVRTGPSDAAKIVLADDSVLDIAPDSEMSLDTLIVDEPAHRFQAMLHLVRGKIRAWVSEYYRQPRARFELETPTAVAGVRGTEFVALYSSATERTDIVGIGDQVE